MNFNLAEKYRFQIFDQKKTQMCVATAVLTAIEYIRQIKGHEYVCYSRIYTYFFSRIELGMPKCDTGLRVCDVIDSFDDYGMLQQQNYSDNFKKIDRSIPNSLQDRAIKKFNFNAISIRISPSYFKKLLRNENPIVAILVCNSGDFTSEPSIIEKEASNGSRVCHCVCIIGFEENCFIFQNSSGTNWKFAGFGKLRFDAIFKIKHAFIIQDNL